MDKKIQKIESGIKKPTIWFGLAALIILSCVGGHLYASDYKTDELNRQMTEISSVQRSLSAKIALANEKRDLLEQKVTMLQEEIRQADDPLHGQSDPKAVGNPRIEYNLKLLQLLTGYIGGLNEKIKYFQNGYQLLDFYLQEIRDDLLMIKTLNDLEIDRLVGQINGVLDEFIPEISKPIFDTQGIMMKDIDKIWQETVR